MIVTPAPASDSLGAGSSPRLRRASSRATESGLNGGLSLAETLRQGPGWLPIHGRRIDTVKRLHSEALHADQSRIRRKTGFPPRTQ